MKIDKIKIENGLLINVDTVEDRDYLMLLGIDIEKVEAVEADKIAKIEASINAKMNADYKGTNVSLTSSDALGLLQVQSAFSLGVASTKFVFENGTVLDMQASDFAEFATWFAVERNKLFV